MNVLLIRHTRLAAAEGICYGRSEMKLAETFSTEAAATAAQLPWPPAVVYTSPSKRCRALAEFLAGDVSPRVDTRLCEMDFGGWEGRRWDDLKGPDVEAWMADPWHARPPWGETVDELVERVADFRTQLLARPEAQVAIVTHAGVIRVWRSLAENRPLPELFAQPIVHGSVWAEG